MSRETHRPRAEVDLGALQDNVRALAEEVQTPICAVVKADAYGHGAADSARAALAAGAAWLAVATLPEACDLARSVPPDTPILVLSQRLRAELEEHSDALPQGIRLSVSSRRGVSDAADLAGRLDAPIRVHLAIDTGMRREGAGPAEALGLAATLADAPGLRWEGTWTHMACADDPADPFTDRQLDVFDRLLADLRAAGFDPGVVHAANSATALLHPRGRFDLARIGIAMYGVPPAHEASRLVGLKPVMRLTAPLAELRSIDAGESVSYGRRYVALAAERIATLPIGYADGVRRSSGVLGVDVLVGGRRCPIVGNVTMDSTMAAVAADAGIGDECVLIGSQGAETISAAEVAERLGTIAYEVLVSVGGRVRRAHIGSPGSSAGIAAPPPKASAAPPTQTPAASSEGSAQPAGHPGPMPASSSADSAPQVDPVS